MLQLLSNGLSVANAAETEQGERALWLGLGIGAAAGLVFGSLAALSLWGAKGTGPALVAGAIVLVVCALKGAFLAAKISQLAASRAVHEEGEQALAREQPAERTPQRQRPANGGSSSSGKRGLSIRGEERVYRALARFAQSDGPVDRTERSVLAKVADALRLDAETTRRLEREGRDRPRVQIGGNPAEQNYLLERLDEFVARKRRSLSSCERRCLQGLLKALGNPPAAAELLKAA